MRGREFMMKDGYSFDADEQGAEQSYGSMWDAYNRVFTRCGLQFRAVEADSGPIGGSFSHEFMVLADTGEDTIVSCTACDYAANMEKAETRSPTGGDRATSARPFRKVETPGASTIEQVSAFLKVQPHDLIKTLIFRTDKGPVAVLVRGDHDLNEVKVRNFLKVDELELADERTIEEVTGGPLGFSGPVGLKNVRILADQAIRSLSVAVVGANEKDVHLADVDPARDFQVNHEGDFRMAVDGDRCPRCESGTLVLGKGIEVGHVFKLGVKYSEAMNCRFLDADGKERPMVMGCYGIGVSRLVAAAIEQNHDADGIVFPPAIAPFTVIVSPVGAKDSVIESAAEEVYQALWSAGVDTLLDDRDERPGVKFKDADLIGMPFRVTVGKRALADGKVELRSRSTKEVQLVELPSLVEAVQAGVASWQSFVGATGRSPA
jgi:prolyl-tRNA synthetase